MNRQPKSPRQILVASTIVALAVVGAIVACAHGATMDSDRQHESQLASAVASISTPTTGASVEEPVGTIMPMPLILRRVIPRPGGSLSLKEYNAGTHGDNTWFGRSSAKVCAEYGPIEVESPGDQGIAIYDHTHLWVDNVVREIAGEYQAVASLEQLLDDQGTPISESTGPAFVCWSVDLAPGVHTAKWSFDTISGRSFSYEWRFEITD